MSPNPPNNPDVPEMVERIARAILARRGFPLTDLSPPYAERSVIGSAIADATAALQSIDQAGLVIVPREPTEAMTYAARYALAGDRSGNIAAPIYRAMIDARPTGAP